MITLWRSSSSTTLCTHVTHPTHNTNVAYDTLEIQRVYKELWNYFNSISSLINLTNSPWRYSHFILFYFILYEPYNFSLLIKTKINKMKKKLFWLNLNFYEELPKCTLQFLFVKKNKFLYWKIGLYIFSFAQDFSIIVQFKPCHYIDLIINWSVVIILSILRSQNLKKYLKITFQTRY